MTSTSQSVLNESLYMLSHGMPLITSNVDIINFCQMHVQLASELSITQYEYGRNTYIVQCKPFHMDKPGDMPVRTAGYGYVLRHDWPYTVSIGGCGNAAPEVGPDGVRTTGPFLEVYPDGSFIRGEGATIEEAEDKAWAEYQRHVACPGHEFEAHTYRNGSGICRLCRRFQSNVFTAEELQMFCSECRTPTFHQRIGSTMRCKEHEVHGENLQRARFLIDPNPSTLELLLRNIDEANDLDAEPGQSQAPRKFDIIGRITRRSRKTPVN